jgi:hypothetical protein
VAETLQCAIEHFGGPATLGSPVPSVPCGTALHVSGWVVDPVRGSLPRRVFGLVDDNVIVDGATIARHDVSRHFGNTALTDCGFDLAVSTRNLVPREHTLSIVAQVADGSFYRVEHRRFNVTAPVVARPSPRVIVSGAPKSGSTYTWLVLTKYFRTEELPPNALFRGTQPLLDEWALDRLRGRAYVAHMHLSPSSMNVRAIAEEAIVPVVLWRNLGDSIVSNDDHYRKLYEVAHDEESSKYFAMESQVRYRFLIRFRLAEYISFYLGWRKAGVPVFRFEEMIADEAAYFRRIITHITGEVDEERLAAARAATASESQARQNKNVGRIGRSITEFSDETKALLEETLRHYYEPLDDLIAELPWSTDRLLP